MIKNLRIPLLLVMMLFNSIIASSAYNFKVDGIYYNYISLIDMTVAVTYQGSEYSGSVTIPETVTYNGATYSVTTIGSSAFYGCTGLTSVTIPNSVTTIGDYAFYGCTGLTSVTIGNSVTTIGSSAFYGCDGLTLVTIPNSVTTIGDYAFYYCTGLTGTIPNSVTTIGDYAFYGCTGLTGTIPNSVTTIGQYVFYGCTGLTSVTIGNSVTTIGDYAFYGCTGFTSVTIPNSVTTIGTLAFYGCTGLTSVTIGNSVTSIDYGAFRDCDGLTSVTIGNSVTAIGSYAFDGTKWYNNQPNGILYLDNCCLGYKGKKPTGELMLNSNTRLIADKAFYECDGLTSVTIGNSVTTIGQYAFYGCTGLTSVTIGNSVTSIGSRAFSDCRGLTSVVIPNSVTEIGSSAFSGCRGLRSVTIGNSVATIGYGAFYDCGIRLIMCHCATPPVCAKDAFYCSYTALLMIPEGSLIDYALADEWYKFTQVHEVSEANVSTQKKSATFEIPTIEGATQYVASVYSDATMSQLVATTNYDAYGKITPMSTTLELSIDGFDEGVYYYKVYVKSQKGEVLKVYIGTFEIELAGIEDITIDETDDVEVERYDVHGRRLEQPTRGINIIKMSDGTTRKEWVK